MSDYNPPNENLPIFNSINFDVVSANTIDLTGKLDFPIAQGAETLQAISVSGTASFTNVANPTSTATQPAPTDSSTKIPTTAWVQSAIEQYFQPITQTSVNTAVAFYPPTPYHLKATGYIIAQGGSAGITAMPDGGTWTLGGAGGGGGAISFSNIILPSNSQYLLFVCNAYDIAGYVAIIYGNPLDPPLGTAYTGGAGQNGVDGSLGGSGSSGLITGSYSGATISVVNGTAGGNGTSFSNTDPPLPVGGTNPLNPSYGVGQRNQSLIGFTSGGYVNVPAGAVGQMFCSITWSVPSLS